MAKEERRGVELSTVEAKIIARKLAKTWNDKFNKGSSIQKADIGAREFQELANNDKSFQQIFNTYALKIDFSKTASNWDKEVLKAIEPLVKGVELGESVKDYQNSIALAFKTYSQSYLGIDDAKKLKRITPSTTKIFNVFDIIAFEKKKGLPNPSDLGVKSLKDSVASLSLEGAKKLVELLK
jgi:hypothetical protein